MVVREGCGNSLTKRHVVVAGVYNGELSTSVYHKLQAGVYSMLDCGAAGTQTQLNAISKMHCATICNKQLTCQAFKYSGHCIM